MEQAAQQGAAGARRSTDDVRARQFPHPNATSVILSPKNHIVDEQSGVVHVDVRGAVAFDGECASAGRLPDCWAAGQGHRISCRIVAVLCLPGARPQERVVRHLMERVPPELAEGGAFATRAIC